MIITFGIGDMLHYNMSKRTCYMLLITGTLLCLQYNKEDFMKKKILIEGMSCNKCVGHVKAALEDLDGVTSVEVSLEGKNAIVETTANDEALKEVIEDEGYDVVKIEVL